MIVPTINKLQGVDLIDKSSDCIPVPNNSKTTQISTGDYLYLDCRSETTKHRRQLDKMKEKAKYV
jgi:hypothetical protein